MLRGIPVSEGIGIGKVVIVGGQAVSYENRTVENTEEEKKRFIEVMTQKMDKLEGNISLLNNIYLEIYANPVKNQLKL